MYRRRTAVTCPHKGMFEERLLLIVPLILVSIDEKGVLFHSVLCVSHDHQFNGPYLNLLVDPKI